MSDPVSPRHHDVTDAKRRRLLVRLPLAAGAIVLPLCWIALRVTVGDEPGACYGGMSLETVGDGLAHDLHIYGDSDFDGPLALFIYASVSFIPFLLLWGCVLLAARASSTRFLAVQAVAGVALISIYFALGYWAASSDLAQHGMFCSAVFNLVPLAGVIAGAGAIVVASLAAFVVARQKRTPS
jgi:hypothetical protein